MGDQVIVAPGPVIEVSMPDSWTGLDVLSLAGRRLPVGDQGGVFIEVQVQTWNIVLRTICLEVVRVYRPYSVSDLALRLGSWRMVNGG